MGWITPSDALALVSSLQLTLRRMGFKPRRDMIKAALEVIASSQWG
jgi:aspartate aminotransferase-like enzyme